MRNVGVENLDELEVLKDSRDSTSRGKKRGESSGAGRQLHNIHRSWRSGRRLPGRWCQPPARPEGQVEDHFLRSALPTLSVGWQCVNKINQLDPLSEDRLLPQWNVTWEGKVTFQSTLNYTSVYHLQRWHSGIVDKSKILYGLSYDHIARFFHGVVYLNGYIDTQIVFQYHITYLDLIASNYWIFYVYHGFLTQVSSTCIIYLFVYNQSFLSATYTKTSVQLNSKIVQCTLYNI